MEEVAELLRAWELPALIPAFTEQQINIQALSALSDADIKEIIPKTGPRALFSRCWRTWRNEFLGNSSTSNFDFSILDDIIVVPAPSNENEPPKIEEDEPPKIEEKTQCQKLENLLKKDLDTAALLTLKGQSLKGDSARNLLASAIAKEILQETTGTINGCTYYKWAGYIKEVFPGERTTTYYIPACTTANGIVLQAKGKLVNQVLNKRRRLQELGALPKGKRYREDSPASVGSRNSPRPIPERCLNNNDINNESVADDLNWLQNSSEPWSLVEEKWKKTFEKRTLILHSTNEPIEAYFAKYPALKKPHGYLLLQYDFDAAHELYKHNLFINFPLMKAKLLQLLKDKKGTETFLQQLIGLFESSNEETTSLAAFLSIPYLLNSSSIRQKKKKKTERSETWKPSKAETREGFIKHVKSDGEIAQAVQQRLASLQKKGAPSQPYIIVVGETLAELKSFLIVASDSVIYERSSISQAVDTCYKIVWALNLEYGIDTYPVWYFIQKGLYKMCSKYDKGSTAVESLLTDCSV